MLVNSHFHSPGICETHVCPHWSPLSLLSHCHSWDLLSWIRLIQNKKLKLCCKLTIAKASSTHCGCSPSKIKESLPSRGEVRQNSELSIWVQADQCYKLGSRTKTGSYHIRKRVSCFFLSLAQKVIFLSKLCKLKQTDSLIKLSRSMAFTFSRRKTLPETIFWASFLH